MRHAEVTLDDKFLLTEGRVFITGVEALLRVLDRPTPAGCGRGPAAPPASSPAIAARRWAASTSRPGSAEEIPAGRRHHLQGRAERGPGRHGGLGQPAGGPLSGDRQVRWRLLACDATSARRRPHRRRLQARQFRRRLPQGQGSGGGRRRPATASPRLAAVAVQVRLPGLPDRGAVAGRTCRRCWTTACWVTPCRRFTSLWARADRDWLDTMGSGVTIDIGLDSPQVRPAGKLPTSRRRASASA